MFWRARRLPGNIFSRQGWTAFKLRAVYVLRNPVLLNRRVDLHVGEVSFSVTPRGGKVAKAWAGNWFERYELEFMSKGLRPQATFLDVGAHIGLFTLAAAVKKPSAKVHAFEPTEWTAGGIRQNVRLNNSQNVVARQASYFRPASSKPRRVVGDPLGSDSSRGDIN